jgi:CHAD domain-containing protein
MRAMSQLFLLTFQDRWDKFGLQLETCCGEFSEAAVHDLRVAARRLMAGLGMAHSLDPHPRLQKTRRLLKAQIDELDDLRDCQVMLVQVTGNLGKHPELAPLHPVLLAREKRLLRKARKQIKQFEISTLMKRMEKIRTSLEAHLARPEVEAELLQAVDDAYAAAVKRYGQIDSTRSASIHRVRLAFKKFRYMVEIIHPALPEFPEDQLKRMHAYQSLMGEVQDAESFLNLLGEIYKADSSFDPKPVHRYFKGLRAERISNYLDDQGKLPAFWRPAPGQAFPWQTHPNGKGEA